MEWQGLSPDDATWEPRESFAERYPDFLLEDELFPEDRRDVRAQDPASVQEQPPAPAWITTSAGGGAQVAGSHNICFPFMSFNLSSLRQL